MALRYLHGGAFLWLLQRVQSWNLKSALIILSGCTKMNFRNIAHSSLRVDRQINSRETKSIGMGSEPERWKRSFVHLVRNVYRTAIPLPILFLLTFLLFLFSNYKSCYNRCNNLLLPFLKDPSDSDCEMMLAFNGRANSRV